MDVIIAIQFGIRHTSNACMIKHDQPNEFEEFNVVFDTKSNTQLQTKSHTTPTVALFDDNGGILSYGFEAELQNKQFNNASSHPFFREFIWDLFCSKEMVSLILIQHIFNLENLSESRSFLCLQIMFTIGSRKSYCRERQANEVD